MGTAEVRVDKPVPVAVAVKDTPREALLACPDDPTPFPVDQAATIPAGIRAAIIDLASAYSTVRDQLVRLIEFHRPGACHPAPR